MPNIVLIDNHEMILESLSLFIESNNDHQIAGKFTNGPEATDFLRKNHGSTDVVICDINMPEMNGLEILSHIRKKHAQIPVIFLTQYAGEHFITKSIHMGVNAYILKNSDGHVLLDGINRVYHGDFFMCQESNAVVIDKSRKDALKQSLTDKEKKIIKLISIGKPSDEIAVSLKISKHTVAFHRKNIYDKLKVNSIPELTIYALQSGLLLFQDGINFN